MNEWFFRGLKCVDEQSLDQSEVETRGREGMRVVVDDEGEIYDGSRRRRGKRRAVHMVTRRARESKGTPLPMPIGTPIAHPCRSVFAATRLTSDEGLAASQSHADAWNTA